MTDTKIQPIGRIMLKNARLAFPNLFEPVQVNGEGEPRYNATLLLAGDHPQLKELRAKIKAVAVEKWNKTADATLKAIAAKDAICLHDGDTKSQYDGFAGGMFVAAAAQANARPTVIDGQRSPVTAKDGKVYAGCYVNASIELWAQDNKWGKRVNAQLRGVQFLRDGDAFSAGRPADSDEFEDVTDGTDAEDFA